MKYLFLALLLISSVIHLYHSWIDDAKHRPYTKPFLLLFIIGYYLVSTQNISWFLLLALIASWLGDVLLIPKGHNWFRIGGTAFLIGHALFIGVYVPQIDFTAVPWLLMVPAAAVYAAISYFVMRAVKPTTPEYMVKPMHRYLLINSTMNLFALMQLLTVGGLGALITYIGAVLFFASDCSLFIVRYHASKGVAIKRHFTVMLTYIAGEFLITLGTLMVRG